MTTAHITPRPLRSPPPALGLQGSVAGSTYSIRNGRRGGTRPTWSRYAGSYTDAKRRRASMGAAMRRDRHAQPTGSTWTRSRGKRSRRLRGESCAEEIRLWHSPQALTGRRRERAETQNTHASIQSSDSGDARGGHAGEKARGTLKKCVQRRTRPLLERGHHGSAGPATRQNTHSGG